MRVMVCLVAVLMVGCPSPADPMPDAAPVCAIGADCSNAPEGCSWCADIGERCDSSQTAFCAGGVAHCATDSVCREYCNAVTFPRCANGSVEHHDKSNGADVCTCVPI